jgi:hypothetical protein
MRCFQPLATVPGSGRPDAGMPKSLAVAPRLLVQVGLRFQRFAPLAERMQVALAVGAAIDDGSDVVARPGIPRAKRAAAAEAGIAPAAKAFEHAEPHAWRHWCVVGSANPLSERAGHRGSSAHGAGRRGSIR